MKVDMLKRQAISAALFVSFVAMATMADVVKVGNLNYHYVIEEDGIAITNVTGASVTVNVPSYVNVNGENIPVVRIKKKSFLGARNTLRSVRSVTIPDSVIDIEPCAFYLGSGLTLLTKLVLPFAGNTDQWFKGLFFEYDYGYETDGNLPYTLAEIVITGGTSVPRASFRNARRRVYDGSWEHPYPDDPCADSEYADAFKVSLPESITTIGYEAFRESALASIDLPHGLTNISPYAFYRCQALRSIEIPDSVIGELPSFYNCVSLTNITIGSGITGCQFDWTYSYSFKQIDYSSQIVTNLVFVTENLPLLKSVRTTDLSAWCKMSYNNPSNNPLSVAHNLYLNNSLITRLAIPSGVDSIEQYAFYGGSKIEKATIPDSVTHVGKGAFVGCKNSLFDTNTIPSLVLVDGWVVEPSWPILEPRGDGGFVEFLTRESDLDLTGVRGIADYAFDGYTYLENLTIGPTVKGIGRHAFDGSRRLVNLTIDSSVKNFGEYAFANCTSLTNLTIGSSADNIGDYAFVNCTNIERITILGNVTNVGRIAFNDCSNLKRIVVMGSITNASPYAFPHLPHIKVCISKNSRTDFASIFPNTDVMVFDPANPNPRVSFDAAGGTVSPGSKIVTRLEKYGTLPVPVRTGYVFEGWLNGNEIVDANTVVDEFAPEHTLIARWSVNPNWHLVTFDANGGEGIDGKTRWCELMEYGSAIIPPTVTRKYCIFAGWSPSVAATVPGEDVTYTAQWHSPWLTIEGTTLKKVDFHGISFSEMLIPDVVTDIGSYAFSGCGSLTSLTIPSNVTNIGNAVFVGCANLSSIDVDSNNQYFSSQNRLILSKDGRTLIQGIGGNVTIPDCVTNINEYAFSGYSDLKSVAIPASVKSIGIYAFDYCENLEEVHIDDVSAWCKIRFEDLYSGAGSGGSGVTPKGNPFRYAKKLYVSGERISELVIPPDVDEIERYAFAGISNIEKVRVTGNAYINEYSFCRCGNLQDVVIGEAVPNVSRNAFADCSSLKHVTFSGSYTDVWTNAFPGCNTELYDTTTIPGVICIGGYAFGLADGVQLDTLDLTGVKGIAMSAFSLKDCLRKVNLPSEMLCVGQGAFAGCTNLVELTISMGVAEIGYAAFYDCSGLSCVTIPQSVTNIGVRAFGGCSSLWGVVFAGNAPSCPAYSSDYSFQRVDPDCVAYVQKDSTGWVVDEDGKWNGITLRYVDEAVPIAAYRATFDANGGEGGWSKTMGVGATVIPPTVTREGYAFVGWSPSVPATMPTGDVTYTAQWALNKYVITFDANGGDGGWSQELEYGTEIVPPIVAKNNYIFKGWSPTVAATVPASNVTYKAQWMASNYVVTFDANGGDGGWSRELEYGSEIVPPNVMKDGYLFVGWVPAVASIVPAKNVTYRAIWQKADDATTFNVVGGILTKVVLNGNTSVIIPDGVTRIEAGAFAGCSDMEYVSIPDSVTSIGRGAFSRCGKVLEYRTVYRSTGSEERTDDIILVDGWAIDNETYIRYKGTLKGKLQRHLDLQDVRGIADYAFENCRELTSVTIAEEARGVGAYAFYGCWALTNVAIPDCPIGDYAFEGTYALSGQPEGLAIFGTVAYMMWGACPWSVIIPEGVTRIAAGAFKSRSGLASVTIPDSVTSIGSFAFYDCPDLSNVTIGSGVTSIEHTSFAFCTNITCITIPNSVVSVGDHAFVGCTGLADLTIMNGLTSIGYQAFSYCRGLTSLTIPYSVTNINGWAFSGCSGLTNITFTGDAPRVASDVLDVNDSCIIQVPKCSQGWDDDGDGKWKGVKLWYVDEQGQTATYRITFDANGGDGGWSQMMEYGAAIEPPTVTRTGYTFIGWSPSVAAKVPARDVTFVAQWEINQYTVTFDANGGSGGWNRAMEYGAAIVPPTVTRAGYTFIGWSPSVAATVPVGGASYTAQWKVNQYTMTFDANGGTGGKTVTQNYGAALTAPTVARTGYTFKGWSPTVPAAVPSGNATYVAQWEINKYTLAFNANGGTGGWSRSMEYGAAIEPPTVTRAGYTFIGWSPSVAATVPVGGASYMAQWKVNQYTVTFDANGGTGGKTVTQNYGTVLTAPTVSRTGYTFKGWSPTVPVTVPAGNATYVAQWQINKYTVTFNANGGTGGWSRSMEYGAAIMPPTVTRTGYTFIGWSSAVAGTVPAGNITYTAQWKVNQYTVTFDANGGEGGTSVTQDYGTSLVAPVVTRTGYTFKGWSPAVPATVPAGNATYVAQWEINKYTTTFELNGGDGDGQIVVEHGTKVGELPVPTRTGHTFAGWFTAAVDGEQVPDDATITGDTTLYAQWTVNKYAVTFDANGGDGGTSVTQDYGTALAAPMVTRTGYTFKGWSPVVPATVPAENATYVAQWEIIKYTVTFDVNGGLLGSANRIKSVTYGGTCGELPTPKRDYYAFLGWFTTADGGDGVTSETAFYDDATLYAHWRYVETGVDIAPAYETSADGTFTLDLHELLLTATMPKLTFKRLPLGLKYDPKNSIISGKATKPGVYKVTVSATSATVKKPITAEFEIVVPNLMSEVLPGLEQDRDVYGVVMCGVAFDPGLVNCSPESGWTVKAAGLPSGLKCDAKTGKISGVPTKAGTYTVTFTASKGKERQTATITLTTEALPAWATGTFAGSVKLGEELGSATMTVAANGKISGKIATGGTNWTFSAASFSRVERAGGSVATNFVVEAVAKARKETRTVVLSVAACDCGRGATALPNGVVKGTFDDGEVKMWRNVWKDKATAAATKAEIARFEGVYTVSVEDGVDHGSGYLSLTVGKNGDVKASGKLADGTSVSATSPLVYDEQAGWFVMLYAAPAAYKGGAFAAAVGFEEAVAGRPPYRLAPVIFAPQWSSRNMQATGDYGKGFVREVDFVGAYYNKLETLRKYYESLWLDLGGAPELGFTYKETSLDEQGRKATTSSAATAQAADTLWQDGTTAPVNDKGAIVVAKATKPVQDRETKEWSYDGANDGGLTLSFTQATGIFKGSYTFWYDYVSAYDETTDKETMAHTSKKVNFEGILVQGEEPKMEGFYLWDATGAYEDEKTGKPKTYKFKQSFSVWLFAQ